MEKNIIFVDFFNTIISRKVSPNDIIYCWAKNVGKEFLIEPSLIYGLFKKISRKIAIKNKFKYWELEFKYVDCVNMLAKQLKRYYKELDLIEFVHKAYEIYINTEANSHIVNEKLIDKLREFKQSNKRLFVVSDFYCDSSAIKTWLSRFKIDDLFEKIYTSSECMCVCF